MQKWRGRSNFAGNMENRFKKEERRRKRRDIKWRRGGYISVKMEVGRVYPSRKCRGRVYPW